mgnify:CR=1 FL=1
MPSGDQAQETTPLLPRPEADLSTQPQQDEMTSLLIWKAGALFGASAVALGAFGAHGLKNRITDPRKLANWGTAAQYQVG